MPEHLRRIKWAAVIFAIIVIPLMYSFFYLYAFWNPYRNLHTMPVAVVNEDRGSVIQGKESNIGRSIVSRLKTDHTIKWQITSLREGKAGLEQRRYYALIRIPADFSKNIATAGEEKKIPGLLIYEPNEKRNFLAAQIMSRAILELKETVARDLTRNIVHNLVLRVKSMPDDLRRLDQGLGQLEKGAVKLNQGMGRAVTGQSRLRDGLLSIQDGLVQAKDGSSQLLTGADQLTQGTEEFQAKLTQGVQAAAPLVAGSHEFKVGIRELENGSGQIASGTTALVKGSKDLDQGTKTYYDNMVRFDDGLNQYVDSVQAGFGKVSDSAKSMSAFLNKHRWMMIIPQVKKMANEFKDVDGQIERLNTASSQLKDGSRALLDGARQIQNGSHNLAEGATILNDGTMRLHTGIKTAADSYAQLDNGINTLYGGMQTAAENAGRLKNGMVALRNGMTDLSSGMDQAVSGSHALVQGSTELTQGQKQLHDGSTQLKDGLKTAHDQVDQKLKSLPQSTKALANLDRYVSDPVRISEQRINPVPDYGTGFAPYFLSLSLYVGAIMMFFGIYLDPKMSFGHSTANGFRSNLVNFLRYAILGIAQAVVLGLVLKNGLHLVVKNTVLFYGACMLISMCFVSIVQLFIVNLSEIGKFLTIALLILQLTACGGTFPMELLPSFFRAINPFMPMTYSVYALKEVISGVDYAFLWRNLLVLTGIFLCFLSVSLILSTRASTITITSTTTRTPM